MSAKAIKPSENEELTLSSHKTLLKELNYLRLENAYLKKFNALVQEKKIGAREKAQIVDELRLKYSIVQVLNVVGIARSTFYYQRKKSLAEDKYFVIKQQIKSICYENRGRYGYRRVTAAMRQMGELINHKTVQRLMKVLGLKSLVRSKRYISFKGNAGLAAPNRLKRNFSATKANQKWTTDVTEFNVAGEKLYLQSMSRKGNCLDNAAMESFFAVLKTEFFYLNKFTCIEQLEKGIQEYIHYYNHDRIKLKLKGPSPVQYRNQSS